MVTAAVLTIAFSSGFALNQACAKSTANNAAKSVDPAKSFKVPPLPNGSAHVVVQPGMSKKDWHDAYKETGRPKFKLNTVKRLGGTVERD
ncbi:hypothetical protein CIW54_09270 [Paraburkholderia sp. T12-10]|nr:hypothetical protein CIW54_09270 [Paraburkholderia sp. T12-10]